MRLLFISQTLCLFFYLLITALVYAETTVVEPAQTAFDNGQFEQAISLWQKVLAEKKPSQKNQRDIQIKLASAYQKLGFYQNAFNLLQKSLTLAKNKKDQVHQAIILSELGDLYLSGYQDKNYQEKKKKDMTVTLKKEAKHYFDKAIEIARQTNDKLVIAKVLNKQGNLLIRKGLFRKAINTYKESEKLAREVGNSSLIAKTLINMTKGLVKRKTVVAQLMKALDATQELKASHDKSFGLMALSNMTSDISDKLISKSAKRWIQYTALQSAQQSAETTQDIQAKSYAYGYMGKLYEDEKRYNEALELTRQALFFAQQTALPELMYRWYWQWGRVLKAQGKLTKAINMYQYAIDSIRSTNIKECNRSILLRLLKTGYHGHAKPNFYDKLGKLYFELADLLIKKGNLQRALDTVENFKIVELQYYFNDDCRILEKEALERIKVPEKVAILYPILLPERIELLVKLPTNLLVKNKTVSISEKRVNQLASDFYYELSQKNNNDYKQKAWTLYDWLIAPIKGILTQHDIKTLVVVPDKALRLIPFAALHDRQEFLIQKYAIATLPSLRLSNLKELSRKSLQIFLGGISKPVTTPYSRKKSRRLPSVPDTLEKIQVLYRQNSKKFLDSELTKSIFEKEMVSPPPYTIVHIASHSVLAQNPEKSYLLLYNEYLTMDNLENLFKFGQFQKQPVELLALSACETAIGDDYQAGLGLAGVAVKAGVKSTLANLWLVDDASAAKLSVAFYKHLLDQKLTKAQALQKAQQELLQSEDFQHPSAWAPMVLIGNWR